MPCKVSDKPYACRKSLQSLSAFYKFIAFTPNAPATVAMMAPTTFRIVFQVSLVIFIMFLS